MRDCEKLFIVFFDLKPKRSDLHHKDLFVSFGRNVWFRHASLANSNPEFYRNFRLVSANQENYFSSVFRDTTAYVNFS